MVSQQSSSSLGTTPSSAAQTGSGSISGGSLDQAGSRGQGRVVVEGSLQNKGADNTGTTGQSVGEMQQESHAQDGQAGVCVLIY